MCELPPGELLLQRLDVRLGSPSDAAALCRDLLGRKSWDLRGSASIGGTSSLNFSQGVRQRPTPVVMALDSKIWVKPLPVVMGGSGPDRRTPAHLAHLAHPAH